MVSLTKLQECIQFRSCTHKVPVPQITSKPWVEAGTVVVCLTFSTTAPRDIIISFNKRGYKGLERRSLWKSWAPIPVPATLTHCQGNTLEGSYLILPGTWT